MTPLNRRVLYVKDGITYFELTETEKREIAEKEALNNLSTTIKAHIQNPVFPLTKEWVREVWRQIEEYAEKGCFGCSNDDQIDMAKLVLDAISKNQCTDPAECAETVKGFACYPW